jgi:hypothetical protein
MLDKTRVSSYLWFNKLFFQEVLMKTAVNMPSLQYITTEGGQRTSVVLSLEDFHDLLEDLSDLAVLAERRDEPTISHEDLLTGLKRDGLL